jgi:hypothetical protein
LIGTKGTTNHARFVNGREWEEQKIPVVLVNEREQEREQQITGDL